MLLSAHILRYGVYVGICRKRYSIYGEMYPFSLTEQTAPNQGRTFPYRGMTYEDYSSILSGFGTHPWITRVYRPNPNRPGDMVFDDEQYLELCTYIESGIPVLASFLGHVMTVIGHTIDYSKTPNVDLDGFIDSSSFYKSFIVMDDNFPPYQLLGDFNDPENYGALYAQSAIGDPQGISMKSIVVAVCPLPEKVFLTATQVRTKGRKYFLGYRDKVSPSGEPIVLRLFLATNTSFQGRKIQAIDYSKPDVLNYAVANMKLPHFLWVMEAGPLSLYQRGKCTSEIVMDSTANPNEDANVYMRVRNTLIYEGMSHVERDAPEEFSQYTHNLGEM